jgi:TolB-like protein/DNA-binding winged helix-turn-helix (wHTH) protein
MRLVYLRKFVVDLGRGELLDQAGARVDLRARSLDLLLRLAENAGHVVTKDALMAAVWPDVCVTEDSLTQCVSDIRKAIGDVRHDIVRTAPRKGYLLVAEEAPRPVAQPPSGHAVGRGRVPDRPSLAVLAFDSFSNEPEHSMLGDGLAEDITTELARNRDLTVLARHTSFSVKGQGKTAGDIARLFNVRYLLEGSVRRAGERLIVNAQLIDGHDSRHVWADRYEFGASDVYLSQGALCARIAATLLAEMRQSEEAESLRRPPSNLDVYEMTLRGMAHKHQFHNDAFAAGRAELSQAIALDPKFAPARIYRGYLEILDVGLAISGTNGPADMAAGIEEIQRGIALDPSLGVGYQALGMALGFSGLFEPQLRAAERSVALGPGDAENLAFLSFALSNAGRHAEALEAIERAIELNPNTPAYYMPFKAIALYALDRFEEAARAQTVCADIQPDFPGCYTLGAASDIALGRTQSASERIARLLKFHPHVTTAIPIVANAYPNDPQLRARQLDHLQQAGLPRPLE